MPITRERTTRYKTSDGRPWDSRADAIKHEKQLVLLSCLREAGVVGTTQVAVVEALLAHPGLIIALTGSATSRTRGQETIP
jgi:hypothetical protein